jgi:hypothetical protein
MRTSPRPSQGFALISTLAILTVLVILIVAFAVTMRTERSASQNFFERERALAIGQAMLNRVLADHASPQMPDGTRLKAYEVNANTKLPTPDTDKYYNAATPADGIYTMKPMEGISTKNRLVRISKPETGIGTEAYAPGYWGYGRQSGAVPEFLPTSAAGESIAPQWVDYKEVQGNAEAVLGEVAFTIWDESGSVDVNMAGPDENVNGIAPHDLGFEKLALVPANLTTYLNGPNAKRNRSNFSLREISKAATDNTGDDRWFFSNEELYARGLVDKTTAFQVTTSSRDFDVRPEWDGDRTPVNSEKFLRSYINNPKLFELFTHQNAGAHLVKDNMDERILRQTLGQYGLPTNDEDWMQVMRLLTALRLSLPPFRATASPAVETPLQMNVWTDHDVWGIALNIMQASAPPSDQNLFAFNRATYRNEPFLDPNVRIGARVSPYITETAVKVERLNATQVRVTQYIELWNPYSVRLLRPNGSPINYYYGNWTGGLWDAANAATHVTGGLYSMATRWSTVGPAPNSFRVLELPPKTLSFNVNQGDFTIRARPYIQNAEYWDSLVTGTNGNTREESSSYALSIGPFYSKGGGDPSYNLVHVIPAGRINRKDENDRYIPAWHSFQIDDPRMGPFSRYGGAGTNWRDASKLNPGFRYSWIGYQDQHSLFGIPETLSSPETDKFVSEYGDGFNQNFSDNWPWPKAGGFEKAMATFALPRRPFQNVGELGTVFANRPWRTLSFAARTVPLDTTVAIGNKPQNYPSALLDYLTTIGSTTDNTRLYYKNPAGGPPSTFVVANLNARDQDKRWLFEGIKVVTQAGRPKQIPTGNIRPIRGRINLNTAHRETLEQLLQAPYRVPRTRPGVFANPVSVSTTDPDSDFLVTIDKADAAQIAAEIVDTAPNKKIRPFRTMADLAKIPSITMLHEKYPDMLADAVIGRLAQFGTVRQQIYTVDMVARALSPEVERQRKLNPGDNISRVVTGEVRFLARVYFDTFSRKAFIESIEYR